MGKKRFWFRRIGLLLLFAPLISFLSCRHETDYNDNLPEVCFERDVLPVFLNSCSMTGCHDGTGESDYVLNNYFDISHSVVPGNPEESPVYKAITASSGEDKMPPDEPLSLDNRTTIRIWIKQGARATSCQDPSTQPPGYVNPRACFQRDILPVLVSGCATTGCHDVVTHEEGYMFVSYSTTLTTVTPGNPGESKLMEVITASDLEDSRMPPLPRPRLSAVVIDSISKWISYGAPDEYCGEVCDTVNPVTFSGVIWPVTQTSCTGCHSGTNPSGGWSLENYSDVAAAVSGGLLMDALNGNGVPKMPPAGSFSACRIRQFELWINNGYPDN